MKEQIIKLLGESWYTLLQEDWESDYFHELTKKLEQEYMRGAYNVFPGPKKYLMHTKHANQRISK